MLKQVWTLMRGAAHDRAEEFSDQNALALLRQQIRDAASAVTKARKALAVAMAEQRREDEQYRVTAAKIADFEARAMAALEQHKDDLAREAAETIAHLESDADASEKAKQLFATETRRLKEKVHQAENRLRDVERGLRLATATEATQRMQGNGSDVNLATLKEAEETLERLQQRHAQFDFVAEAEAGLATPADPEALRNKLAEAGCGEPLRSSADSVLERLSAKIKSREATSET